ncbi:uncharacterized protein YjbI with pentapeptide repeats [Paraburkholderia sp. 35.1]
MNLGRHVMAMCRALLFVYVALFGRAALAENSFTESNQVLELHNVIITNRQIGPGSTATMNISGVRPSSVTKGSASDQVSSSHIVLQNTELKGVSWKKKDLSHATLENVGAVRADLASASLRESVSKNVDFSGADLSGVDFSRADLTNVSFDNANLRNSNFEDARFVNVSWSGSDLSGARWTHGQRCLPKSINGCKLE